MSNLTHLFYRGQKVRIKDEEFGEITWNKGIVRDVFPDHIIVDVRGVSDHCWYEPGFNIDRVFPEYNFVST